MRCSVVPDEIGNLFVKLCLFHFVIAEKFSVKLCLFYFVTNQNVGNLTVKLCLFHFITNKKLAN